jgi:hypothetical protein
MNTGSSTTGPSAIERKIIERIVAAKVRLRFDKSVLRLVSGLKAALAEVIPEGFRAYARVGCGPHPGANRVAAAAGNSLTFVTCGICPRETV